MSNLDIIRAWKDPDYRRGLTDHQLAQMPAHPAGSIEFQDSEFVYGSVSPHTKSPCHKSSRVGCRVKAGPVPKLLGRGDLPRPRMAPSDEVEDLFAGCWP
jgi:mersacidin/lichenicidin family type 2 lantibiotic